MKSGNIKTKLVRGNRSMKMSNYANCRNSSFQSLLTPAESLSHVPHFATPWTAACQVPLSIGILQARILEWVAMPSSRGSSQPRNQTQVSLIASRFFTI